MANITNEQLQALRDKLNTLIADKETADAATAASNQAHAVLQAAQADVAQKDAAEAVADGEVNVALGDLQSFVDALATPPPAPPA